MTKIENYKHINCDFVIIQNLRFYVCECVCIQWLANANLVMLELLSQCACVCVCMLSVRFPIHSIPNEAKRKAYSNCTNWQVISKSMMTILFDDMFSLKCMLVMLTEYCSRYSSLSFATDIPRKSKKERRNWFNRCFFGVIRLFIHCVSWQLYLLDICYEFFSCRSWCTRFHVDEFNMYAWKCFSLRHTAVTWSFRYYCCFCSYFFNDNHHAYIIFKVHVRQ